MKNTKVSGSAGLLIYLRYAGSTEIDERDMIHRQGYAYSVLYVSSLHYAILLCMSLLSFHTP